MKAETAYNVIQALPREELQRLYAMLAMPQVQKVKKVRNTGIAIWTLAECTEILLAGYFNKNKSKIAPPASAES